MLNSYYDAALNTKPTNQTELEEIKKAFNDTYIQMRQFWSPKGGYTSLPNTNSTTDAFLLEALIALANTSLPIVTQKDLFTLYSTILNQRNNKTGS